MHAKEHSAVVDDRSFDLLQPQHLRRAVRVLDDRLHDYRNLLSRLLGVQRRNHVGSPLQFHHVRSILNKLGNRWLGAPHPPDRPSGSGAIEEVDIHVERELAVGVHMGPEQRTEALRSSSVRRAAQAGSSRTRWMRTVLTCTRITEELPRY